ncbi:unnamed protein product [Pleuronectes platessa]|uniref:Uncharacterized protein n=1 Tax=Pleuronectes platessa TaxID=8262 RepID=A0A9N7VRB9_PLEPL|nr:unnamed protein product [Pleuronectes platessa]
MKIIFLLFLLLLASGACDDVKYISKRNSDAMNCPLTNKHGNQEAEIGENTTTLAVVKSSAKSGGFTGHHLHVPVQSSNLGSS